MNDLHQWLDFSRGGLGPQVAALLGCLLLAWGLAWFTGRRADARSIWFGAAIVDGVLFPLLALVFVFALQRVWPGAQTLLGVALPILAALAGIRVLARVLTAVFPDSAPARLAERLFSWLAWVAAALWIAGWMPQAKALLNSVGFGLGKAHFTLLDVVEVVLLCVVVVVAALWASAALERRILRDTVHDLSFRKIAVNLTRAALLLLGFLLALSIAGVNLTTLSVLGGALGVGLGFGLQKLAANYVSGFVILFERSLRIGDTVRVDGFEGTVADIKTRYTLIRALNGRESVVPNEKMITERIENLSLADTRVMLSTQATVDYDCDLDQVQQVLVQAAQACPRVLAEPPPQAQLLQLGDNGLEFELQFWIADPQNGQSNVRSAVNLNVVRALRAAAITVPYPQRVLHLQNTAGSAVLDTSGTSNASGAPTAPTASATPTAPGTPA